MICVGLCRYIYGGRITQKQNRTHFNRVTRSTCGLTSNLQDFVVCVHECSQTTSFEQHG